MYSSSFFGPVINWSTRLIMDRKHCQNIWQHLSKNKRNLVIALSIYQFISKKKKESSHVLFLVFLSYLFFFIKIFQHVLHVNWLPINCFAMKSISSHYMYFIYILITLYASFLFFVISLAPFVNFVRKYSLYYELFVCWKVIFF